MQKNMVHWFSLWHGSALLVCLALLYFFGDQGKPLVVLSMVLGGMIAWVLVKYAGFAPVLSGTTMKNFKVNAVIRCRCEACAGKGIREYSDVEARKRNPICEGIRFSDTFSAVNLESAVELARAKFIMIHDDLAQEFEGEGHKIILEISGCEEL